MKLLVGLGNPGSAYQGTRHNVGFEVLEVIARRCGSPARRSRFQGE
ncbi:MAG: aminoacyl-tRNA hydrolase, partial [Pirellulales bacterium]|nr:aminoacyl-tRNA hydrolase [Pirellulales bacterium]